MSKLLHPARAVALAFLLAIVLGTLLLMHPAATASGTAAPWLTAFFTAVSAVCVTGLVVVDTGTYWSFFGQATILVLFQLGGFGMMTAATLLGLMVNRSLRLRTRLVAQVETHSLGLGDLASVARLVLIVTAVAELVLAVVLTLRLRLTYDASWPDAVWGGIFHWCDRGSGFFRAVGRARAHPEEVAPQPRAVGAGGPLRRTRDARRARDRG